MQRLFKTHPWHGVPIGRQAPAVVTVYVEIVPADAVKYEIDKATGHLKIDRPQQFSNVCPTLYGFVPQTYSGESLAALARQRTGRQDLGGDGDPLDICVLSERAFSHGDFLLQAIPIGGLRVIDTGEADDKVVAVLEDDVTFGGVEELADLPPALVERLTHYFLTYKLAPGGRENVEIAGTYGRDEARDVIARARDDYRSGFPEHEKLLATLLDPAGPGGHPR
jgi:inorganic pyrophosphatase